MPLDLDEFVIPEGEEKTIATLLERNAKVDQLLLPWKVFGDNGHKGLPPLPLTDHLVETGTSSEKQTKLTKAFVRNHQARKLDVHFSLKNRIGPNPSRWRRAYDLAKRKRSKLIISFQGMRYSVPQTMADYYFQRFLFSCDNQEENGAVVHHYAVRTRELFALKQARGACNPTDGWVYDKEFFEKFNINGTKDMSVARIKPARDKIMARFLESPQLRRLHENAIDVTNQKLAKIKFDKSS